MALTQSFLLCVDEGPERLIFADWHARHVIHGMTGVSVGFSKANMEARLAQLAAGFGLEKIIVPQQVHGAEVIEVGSSACSTQGDAIVMKKGSDDRIGVGVITADCVPILFMGEQYVGAIHAGWRGLAAGIIQKTLSKYADSKAEILIGPCAGGERYEVGPEVLDAIGGTAVSRRIADKLFLDLRATAQNQILQVHPDFTIRSTGICTISDSAFHSYRRDGAECGRNLAFISG